MSAIRLDGLLAKLKDPDQDLRAMAASDILDALKGTTNQLSSSEGETCTAALVKLLSDTQSHVQNLAMECLGQVVQLLEPETLRNTITSICTGIQQRGRDASNTALSVGLRVMIGRIALAIEDPSVLGSLAAPLVAVLQGSSELAADVMVDIFSSLSDMITHAGAQIAADAANVEQIQHLLLGVIGNGNITIRRRAIAVLGDFVVSVPGRHSDEALSTIFERYMTCTKDSDKCILLRVLVTITRQCPGRVAALIPTIVERELGATEDSEREVRVTLLLVFETFVRYCADIVAAKRDDICAAAASAVRFDPNYNYDDDDDGMDTSSDGDMDDEFGDDDGADDAYDDDQDDSWDVRLSGVKLLASLAKCGLYQPHEVVSTIGSLLVERFKEREDVVRAEVIFAYAIVADTLKAQGTGCAGGAADVLQRQAPRVVAAALAAIKSYPKSTETKQLAFAVFARLVSVNASMLDDSLANILPLVTSALDAEDTSGALQTASTSLVKTNLKLDVLALLRALTACSEISAAAKEFFAVAKDGIRKNVASKTLQVPAAAFDAATGLVVLLRGAAGSASGDIAQFVPWAEEMARCAVPLAAADDHALRASVLGFIGTLLQKFGDSIGAPVSEELLKTLTSAGGSASDTQLVLGAVVRAIAQPTALPRDQVLAVAAGALQQAYPLLSQDSAAASTAALEAVKALAGYGADALGERGEDIVRSIVAIISRAPDSPPVAALQALAAVCPSVSVQCMQGIAAELLAQLAAATVYGRQSAAAIDRLFQIVGAEFPDVVDSWKGEIVANWQRAFEQYAQQCRAAGSEAIQMQFPGSGLDSAAKSINALQTGLYKARAQEWSSEYLSSLMREAPEADDDIALTCLGLRALGYAAAGGSLAHSPALAEQLQEHVGSKHDSVRGEAAAALGKYVGSHPALFAALFSGATAAGSTGAGAGGQSMLQAVKEAVDMIVGANRDRASAGPMWEQITAFAQGSQGPIADALAQSLATFALAFPEKYVPLLAARAASGDGSTDVKAFYITAFRAVLADKQRRPECDAELKGALAAVLGSIDDSDVEIRRLGLLALFTTIQGKPELAEGVIGAVGPALFRRTAIDESLVRMVSMGPFKKRVDDGLEARKAAFQCVHALVRALPSAVDCDAVADSVVRGIPDEYEIRLLVLQIVNESLPRLSGVYEARLDALADAIERAQALKLPTKPVRQEIEKHTATLKATTTLLAALGPAARSAPTPSAKFNALLESAAGDGSAR
ncbi:Cullin-associated NEDD8-dissociated protein 2 [Coemansia biformis]|uniref:Cullin-associated NEDD8-dissociated protein 2 n=1 Tax=Coemansia biformis TaxID=1286918 RepID=A0A9W7YAC1_9FUNG|nr:Cullin-associated NEDD8-dissociated protein 2 [Coemansia biformis]